ncbi:MAG: TetR family transcriptional regulator [Gaiellales bacterium]
MTKSDPKTALVEAAERLLVRDGRTAVTTRRLAAEASLSPGLVHYHFGSVDAVLAQVMERAAERSLAALAAAADDRPAFIDRWRAIVRQLDAEVRSGEAKLLAELAAVALNDERVRARYARLVDDRRRLVAGMLSDAADEYGVSRAAVEPATTLVTSLLQGLAWQRLAGADTAHAELEQWVEGWLLGLAGPAPASGRAGSISAASDTQRAQNRHL